MKRARDYTGYVADMLESAQKALEFVAGMTYEEFVADEKTQYAVVRALEVLGEAAKKVPPEWREVYAEIPWRAIAGMRDKLIHDYIGTWTEFRAKVVRQPKAVERRRRTAEVLVRPRGLAVTLQ